MRVTHGGHDVSPDNIRENYDRGLKNLGIYYKGFDSVHLYHNYENQQQIIQSVPLMTIEAGKIKEQVSDLPEWAKAFSQILAQKQSLENKKELKQEKGQDRSNRLKIGSGYGKDDNEQSRGMKL